MLASLGDYLHVWQLPLFAVFFFGWLVVGGYLIQNRFAKATDNRRYKFGRGVLVSFLAGSGGAMAGGALGMVGNTIFEADKHPISLAAVILMLVGFVFFSLLIIFAMHHLSFKQTASAAAPAVGFIILLAALVGGISYFPAHASRQDQLQRARMINKTIQQMKTIHNALLQHGGGNPPESLQVLVEKELIEKEDIQSPPRPDGPGFFYYPPEKITYSGNDDELELIVVDYAGNQPGGERVVLYSHGMIQSLGPGQFDAIVSRPENRQFREALQRAESNGQ